MPAKRGNSYRVRYRDPKTGSWVSETFSTKTAAVQREREVAVDRRRGTWTNPRAGDITFEMFAGQWLATKADVHDGTKENIEGRLSVHLLPRFGRMRLSAIAPSDVLAWLAEAKGTRAAATLNASLGTLRQILALAQVEGLVTQNAAAVVKPLPNDARRQIHPLSVEHVSAVADAIDPRFRAAILFAALGSGARAGELWALRLDRIDWLRRTVHITESVDETRQGLVTKSPKNGKARTIRVDASSIDLLAEHVRLHPSPGGLVFSSTEGHQLRHRNFMRRHFMPAVRSVEGVPDGFTFHDLRHTHASLLIARGWRPEQVKDRLGHGSIRTTFDWYGHLFEGHDDEQLADLAEVVRGAAAGSSVPVRCPSEGEVIALESAQGR